MGIRRWIYGQAVHEVQSVVMNDDVEDYIHDKVLAYLLSVGPVLDRKLTKMKV